MNLLHASPTCEHWFYLAVHLVPSSTTCHPAVHLVLSSTTCHPCESWTGCWLAGSPKRYMPNHVWTQRGRSFVGPSQLASILISLHLLFLPISTTTILPSLFPPRTYPP